MTVDEQDSLKLQLYPNTYFGDKTNEFLVREDIPGILTTIVIDKPDMIVTANKNKFKELSKHPHDAFSKLIENLKKDKPYSVEFAKLNRTDDEVVAAIIGDDVTTSTHVLVLESLYPQLVGKHGALVGLPHRHMILVKRLELAPSQSVISSFSDIVQYMTNGRSDVLSFDAFHYQNGLFERVN